MQSNTKTQLGIFAALAVLMAATRYNHFGTATALADASLAVFFLAGLFLARSPRLALAAFTLLLVEAAVTDYYVTRYQGVSDWCMTPAYWFLIPTYASLWLGGRWFGLREAKRWTDLGLLAAAAWLSSTVAFVISNVSFYLFSGRYAAVSAAEYAASLPQYYLPYLMGCVTYVAVAASVYIALRAMRKTPLTT